VTSDRIHRRIIACAAILFTWGLSAPLAAQPRTIRYTVPPASAATSLSAPAVTLDPAQCELNRANAVLIENTGALVVVNGGNRELCFFDPAGKFVKKVGRRGAGPGEFEDMSWPSLYRGDSLAITDRRQNRVTIFGPQGERGREFVVLKPDTLGSQTLTVPLASGEFLFGFSEIRTAAPRPEAVVFHQQIVRVPPTGGGGPRVARLPASEHFIQKTPPEMGGTAYWNLAFGRELSVSPSINGFVSGDGSDDVIREYDGAGQVRTHHVTGLARRPVTPQQIGAYREATLKSTRPQQRAVTEKMLEEMPFPQARPAYARVIADPTGPVWVQSYPDSSGSYWIRLNPADASAKAYRFPSLFSLHAARGDRACGIGRDADDLQTVYCFAIPRGR
jgi:hypothetical protein